MATKLEPSKMTATFGRAQHTIRSLLNFLTWQGFASSYLVLSAFDRFQEWEDRTHRVIFCMKSHERNSDGE
jgi:hypothetical protein